jgi:hypothetical protein
MEFEFSEANTAVADMLKKRITILNERAWEHKLNSDGINRWLENFTGKSGLPVETERLHALYLLSQFLYFGSREVRVLLKAVYTDLFLAPLVQLVRNNLNGTRDLSDINDELAKEIAVTRFLGVGNPSESGVHLLYYFRQENGLSKNQFADNAQLITRNPDTGERVLRNPEIKRYVFVDDVCGSGSTAVAYSEEFLRELQQLGTDIEIYYYCLFANSEGMEVVRKESAFGVNCGAVYEFDESYKSLDGASRFFKSIPAGIKIDYARAVAITYGSLLWPNHPLGYKNGQMLLGFTHNTPDNTLPIIWMGTDLNPTAPWIPAFKRYHKV